MNYVPSDAVGGHADFLERAKRVREVAAHHADEVDRDARFPAEAASALRSEKLLSAHVPSEFGGGGATITDLAGICSELGRGCTSTAMAYAMHQIQVGCILRHGMTSPWFRDYVADLVERERLIASATSELGVGGDLRTSRCAIVTDASGFQLEKQASVISYGEHADEILVTARRAPEAAPGDQVLALVRKSDYTLEKIGGWDTLGMRGTCSNGFVLRCRGVSEQILPASFAEIASATMVAYSHVLWTAAWLGVGLEAVARARTFIQGEARKAPGKMPPGALRLAEVTSKLHALRATVEDGRREYERRLADPDALSSFGFVIRMNDLKIASSELLVQVVTGCLGVVGIAAYRNDSPFAMGRLLRDAYGALLQINNDRMYGTNAQLLLMARED